MQGIVLAVTEHIVLRLSAAKIIKGTNILAGRLLLAGKGCNAGNMGLAGCGVVLHPGFILVQGIDIVLRSLIGHALGIAFAGQPGHGAAIVRRAACSTVWRRAKAAVCHHGIVGGIGELRVLQEVVQGQFDLPQHIVIIAAGSINSILRLL